MRGNGGSIRLVSACAAIVLALALGTGSASAASWLEPEDISEPTVSITFPDLAVDPAGHALVVWPRNTGTETILEALERPPGGEWSEATPLSDLDEEEEPQDVRVALGADGDAVAVWRAWDGGEWVLRTAARPAGGEWSEPDDLSDPQDLSFAPDLAIDADGDAVAVWSGSDGTDTPVWAAERPAGGAWSEPELLSPEGVGNDEAELVVEPAGTAHAIWSGPAGAGGERAVWAAELPPGGEWSNPDEVSGRGSGFNSYELDANANAGVIATWTRDEGPFYRAEAAVRPPGGEWGGAEDLSVDEEDAGLPKLGFDAAGNAITVWGRDRGTDYVLQAAGYDFTGPELGTVRIPTSATVGVPVSFSVSPFDLFALGGTSWSFGDGGGAAGEAVSHVYSAPGAYPVTVTAVDVGGNTTTRVAAIAVAAGPQPPPPPPPLALSLRIEKKSLRGLLRSGTLSVTAGVNDAAEVSLSGKATLRVRDNGSVKRAPVSVFTRKTVSFAAAGERKLTLTLSNGGRRALRQLSRVRLVVSGEASGGRAAASAARTLD